MASKPGYAKYLHFNGAETTDPLNFQLTVAMREMKEAVSWLNDAPKCKAAKVMLKEASAKVAGLKAQGVQAQ